MILYILGYGRDYEFELNGKTYKVDLTVKDKELPEDIDYSKGNEFILHYLLLKMKLHLSYYLTW